MLIRNATLPDGSPEIDIAINAGRIVAAGPALPVYGAQEIDAAGDLVTPPFVDAHFHVDATLSYGLPRVNRSGTLLEGIALWGELKPQLTQEALVELVLQYCDLAVARGLLARPQIEFGAEFAVPAFDSGFCRYIDRADDHVDSSCGPAGAHHADRN